jgi:tetratricopeptide (TPR) repeat protein
MAHRSWSVEEEDEDLEQAFEARGTKRRHEYPPPPEEDDVEFAYGSIVRFADDAPSKRQRLDARSEQLMGPYVDEDSDVDDIQDEAELLSDSDAQPSRTSRRGGRGRGRRGRAARGSRGGSRKADRMDMDDDGMNLVDAYDAQRTDDGTRKRRKRAPKDAYEESPEFRRVVGLVTTAWISEDYENALKYALEGIKLQPEAFHLHGTVAEILIKQGRIQDAMDALFSGVHASKEPASWWFVVDRLNEINQGRDDADIKSKLQYCYSTILQLDPKDYRARFFRMNLYRERELWRRARNDCLNLLRINPTDAPVVEALAELTAILEDPAAALETFTSFMEEVLKTETPERTSLTWNILESYTGMLLEAEEYEKGLKQLQVISRWLLGRVEETFWDQYTDDREWDVYPDPRRHEAEGFVEDRFDESSYGLGLPLELRVRLGTLRLLSGDGQFEEAMVSRYPMMNELTITEPL